MIRYYFILNVMVMWSFFGCGNKKAASKEVDVWLEKNFPQQFDIIKNEYAVNTWTSLDRSKFKVLLDLKSDTDVQFSIPWNIDLPNGGTSIEAVKSALSAAKKNVSFARDLLDAVRKEVPQKISIGVSEANEGYVADVLFYSNPKPEDREKWFASIQKALSLWTLSPVTHFWFCFMEEDYFGKDFKEIVPGRFIHELQDNKRDNCIMMFEMDGKAGFTFSTIRSKFEVNLNSRRALDEYGKEAFNMATAWARDNSKRPIYLREDGMSSQVNDHDLMAIDYCIPYFNSKEDATSEFKKDDKISGYVCGTYQVDQKTFKNGRTKKEL